jgi:tetratricopeptide (TPR) repeat protein
MAPKSKTEPERMLIVTWGDLDEESAALDSAVTVANSAAGDTYCELAGTYLCDGDNEVPDPSNFDLIGFLLWRRWGPRSGRYSSAYKRAFATARKAGVDRLIYFRTLPDEVLVDPDEEVNRIIAFRDDLEQEGTEAIAWYDDPDCLERLAEDDLARRYNPGIAHRSGLRTLPDHQKRLAGWADALGQAPRGENRNAFRAVLGAFDLANEGRFTKACQRFARATARTKEPYLMNEYGLFLKANGLLTKAEKVFEDLARMGQFMEDTLVLGSALRHLGDIYEKTGRPDAADAYYRKALSLEEGHDRILKRAGLYESRGILHLKSGSPKMAAKMFRKSLQLYEQADFIEGQALAYYCLTGAYIELEHVEKAMEAGHNALKLFRQLDETAMIDKLQVLLDKLIDMRNRAGT